MAQTYYIAGKFHSKDYYLLSITYMISNHCDSSEKKALRMRWTTKHPSNWDVDELDKCCPGVYMERDAAESHCEEAGRLHPNAKCRVVSLNIEDRKDYIEL